MWEIVQISHNRGLNIFCHHHVKYKRMNHQLQLFYNLDEYNVDHHHVLHKIVYHVLLLSNQDMCNGDHHHEQCKI
jgi:hypothetical protein